MDVRFKRPDIDRGWRRGLLLTLRAQYTVEDETVVVREFRTGGSYVIRREHVQKLVKGPRGGQKWMPL
jgi:hypothetical protein